MSASLSCRLLLDLLPRISALKSNSLSMFFLEMEQVISETCFGAVCVRYSIYISPASVGLEKLNLALAHSSSSGTLPASAGQCWNQKFIALGGFQKEIGGK